MSASACTMFPKLSGTSGTNIWRGRSRWQILSVAKVRDSASIMIVLQIVMWEVVSLYGELCAPLCTLIWDRAARTWIN